MKNLYVSILGMLCFAMGCTPIQAQNQREAKKVTSWNGNSWSNGVPTLETKAIFTANFTSTENLLTLDVKVFEGAKVTIEDNTSLTVTNNRI